MKSLLNEKEVELPLACVVRTQGLRQDIAKGKIIRVQKGKSAQGRFVGA